MLKDFKENEKRTEKVLVLGVEEKKTARGSAFIVCSVTDGETKLEVKFWNTTKLMFEMFIHKVVSMTIQCESYNGGLSYVGLTSVILDEPVTEFVPKVPGECTKMYDYMYDYPFQSETVKKLVQSVLEKYQEQLMYWAAARSMHHAIYGGLLYHMYRMAKASEVYTNIYEVNGDIVTAGVILHDIGKLKELDTDDLGSASFTTEGRLFGHLLLGVMMIEEVAKEIGTPNEIVEQLEHIIASHHGKYEYGAIAMPATKEAEIVYMLDMADSRIYMYEEAYKKVEPGEMSDYVKGLDKSVIKF